MFLYRVYAKSLYYVEWYQARANNIMLKTIEAYSTGTHYEHSNRQLGACIIDNNQNGAVIKIILGV